MHRHVPLAVALLLAACTGAAEENAVANETDLGVQVSPADEPPPPATPSAPDTNEAASEPPVVHSEPAEASPQAAADVVRTYYALLGTGKSAEARALWSDRGEASGLTEEAFANAMLKYQEQHAEVGAPGLPEGAAGSIYVDVPVRVRGIVRGEPFTLAGAVTLRRCNGVPGCTAEQLKWRIADIGVTPQN